ncbi:DNA damage-binding protein 1 [Arachnomyces sp. PD_36]|nr:DNA damage-binding protein 1 [Arachnomyces sp. PD_36]
MSYVVPIHQASSIRHALELRFLEKGTNCLVVAKSNRLQFYTQSPDGLILRHSEAVYGKITMLQRLPCPGTSPTDHLFVGTDRYTYFTVSWDATKRKLRTERSYVDLADKSSRDAQSADRCLVDPSGRFMTLEIYEGVVTVVPIVQASGRPMAEQQRKKGKQVAGSGGEGDRAVGELGEPCPTRIEELVVRSSAFMFPQADQKPRLALLYEDHKKMPKLRIRELDYKAGMDGWSAELEGKYDFADPLEMGASELIPVPAPTGELLSFLDLYYLRGLTVFDVGGLLILGETSIIYLNDAKNESVTRHLERGPNLFVAWAQIDSQSWLLADDYGELMKLELTFDGAGDVDGWNFEYLGETSRASVLVYLGAGMVFVGSHQGDSQLVIRSNPLEVVQTISNIAPILDFTIMDLGSRSGDVQAHEFSSGQARIVTGSGSFNDGSLRSVRSGVGMEELGVLGDMPHITDLWSLQVQCGDGYSDTIVVSFVDETRIFRFSPDGEVEELDHLLGLGLTEATLVAANLPKGRVLQVTEHQIRISDIDGEMVVSEWSPPEHQAITAASNNDEYLVVVTGGRVLSVIDTRNHLEVIVQKDFGADSQISGVTIPSSPTKTCIAGFPQSVEVAVLNLENLEPLYTKSLGAPGEAIPRSVLVANVLPDCPPTLFISIADGSVVTFSFIEQNAFSEQLAINKKGDLEAEPTLTNMSKLILGSEQPVFKKLPRNDGLYNVFATCEHPSLIYASEGKIIYSAVNYEQASRVCQFHSEAYPGSIAVATTEDLKIALVDTERTTQIQTLALNETVRRVAYSASEKAFGIGTIKRELRGRAEHVSSKFILADEIMFRKLDAFELNSNEIVESVIRAELPDGTNEIGEVDYKDRFVVGTAYVDEDADASVRGRILIFEVDKERALRKVSDLPVKGACRALAVLDGKIVAALVKTVRKILPRKSSYYANTPEQVVVFSVSQDAFGEITLRKLASYRTSTAPIDVSVSGNQIAVCDLMKSVSIVEFVEGEDGQEDKMVEVARHFQTVWGTGVAEIDENTYLESDAEGNLIVLRQNATGVTDDDRRRMEVTGEFLLGEMVNRIRPLQAQPNSKAMISPRAFLGTVEGSIYLFGLIHPWHQDFLMRLQTSIASYVRSPGNMPFNKYRAFKTLVRENDEPYRFVDGELIEKFLDLSIEAQGEIVDMVGIPGKDVESVKGIVEALRRLH